MGKRKFNLLQIAVHVGAWLPLAKIIYDFFTDNLTANPIQAIEQRTGKDALILLVLSLACTPLVSLAGWKQLVQRRKALGNYGFMYAMLHVLTFVGIDYGFNFYSILRDVGTKSYILIGLSAFLLLLPLAFTSFQYWMKRLGKKWKTLHKLVYLISPLAVLHFILAMKGDITRLSGNIAEPLYYGLVVLLLLTARLPPVKHTVLNFRREIDRRLFTKSESTPAP